MSDHNCAQSPPPPSPPQYPPPYGGPPQQDPGRGLSIAGMVLGIIALAFSWAYGFGIPIAIVGLVLSIIGMRKSKEFGFPTGMAVAGLVCSCIALGLNLLCVIVLCAACGAVGGCTAIIDAIDGGYWDWY